MTTATLQDQLSRVRMMSTDKGTTWDLSPNDQAALRAVLDAVPQWQPIETAPKDKAILGWSDKVEWDIYAWSTIAGQSFWYSLGPNTVEEDLSAQPTHWMALPSPPPRKDGE